MADVDDSVIDPHFQGVLTEIMRKRDEIRCSKSGAFFRGHSANDHRLIPSLVRLGADWAVEHNLFHECYARSRHLLGQGATSWEALSVLQHHGIPTRLLDWTESFAVSLFFALLADEGTPHVWIVNPFLLNRAAGYSDTPRIPLVGLDPVPDYEAAFVRVDDRASWPYSMPVFVQIPWNTQRVAAQQGFFTIHANSEPLDAVCPRWVRRVDIPTEAVEGARRFLGLAGVNEFTIFPDLQGLGQFLRQRYRLAS